MRFLSVLVIAALWIGSARAEESHERVIFHTSAGDLVFVLDPGAAPQTVQQFVKLVQGGVYDTTEFARIQPGFIAQVSSAATRKRPLTPEQAALIHRLPLEVSALKHVRGALSMAHKDNDPGSGETSFCIMLGAAANLDGKYTVFGRLESGGDVLKHMLEVPRDAAKRPSVRIEVTHAEVVPSAEALAQMKLTPAHSVPGVTPAMLAAAALHAATAPKAQATPTSNGFIIAGLILIVLLGAASTLLRRRISSRHVASLNLAGVLIGAFLLFILLMPEGAQRGWVATALFFGLVGIFKLMGRFEEAEKP